MTQYPEWQQEIRRLQQEKKSQEKVMRDKLIAEAYQIKIKGTEEILGYLGIPIPPQQGQYRIDRYIFHAPKIEETWFFGFRKIAWSIKISLFLSPDFVYWCHENGVLIEGDLRVGTSEFKPVDSDWTREKILLADQIDRLDRWCDRVSEAYRKDNPLLVPEYRRR